MMIRPGEARDAESMVEIRNHLPMPAPNNRVSQSGFLLGSDLNTYRRYIDEGACLVAEDNNRVVGFGIILPDDFLKSSYLWTRRHLASWYVDVSRYENRMMAYFEQLAFLPSYRYWAPVLAWKLMDEVFGKGAFAVFTSTFQRPTLNQAPLGLIRDVGGVLAGNIDEVFPGIGNVNSDIYIIDAEAFRTYSRSPRIVTFLKRFHLA